MICMERKEPEKIGLLRILLEWLPSHHKKRPQLEVELARRLKGYQGEQEVDFFLRLLPNDKYFIFNGLRLIIDREVFQMDTLILSRKFFLIIEIKNYSRKLIYDTVHDQFIHIKYDGTQERVQNPISQADRQRTCLVQLLFKHGYSISPIETFAANSNSRTILESIPVNPQPMPQIYNAENLVRQIHQLDAKYSKDIWAESDIKSLVGLLKKLHTPPTYDLLKEYDIDFDDLIKGVPCPECHFCPMDRCKGGWVCPRCGYRSKDAHVSKINGYLALVKPYITNKECRELCFFESEDTTKRELGKMNLKPIGNTSLRKYYKK